MKFSGERIDLDRFEKGWALEGASFGKGHFWTRKDGEMVAACGHKPGPQLVDMLGVVWCDPGTFGKCNRCARISRTTT